MQRFFIIFISILMVLFFAELSMPMQTHFIIPFTEAIAKISAWLIQRFDDRVVFRGVEIINQETGFAVSIQAGCNGIEAALTLIAAILAFPASWRAKLIGIIIGFLSVQLLNVIRIISLFYLGQWNFAVFDWAHLYIWQALIMLDVLVVFLIWLNAMPLAKTSA